MQNISNRSISNKIIFDWYDRMVKGVFHIEDVDRYFYSNLICTEKKNKIYVYSLIEINQNNFDKLLKVFHPQELKLPIWVIKPLSDSQEKQLLNWIELIYNECSSVILIKAEDIGQEILSEINIEKERINFETISSDFYKTVNQSADEKSKVLGYFED